MLKLLSSIILSYVAQFFQEWQRNAARAFLLSWGNREKVIFREYMQNRGGRFLDFLDFQPVATGSRCKMLF
jgi:hypothetical protein